MELSFFSWLDEYSENVFGIITNRWRVYHAPIALYPDKVREITLAVLALHNWLRMGPSNNAYIPAGFCD